MRRLRDIQGEEAVEVMADLMEPITEMLTDEEVQKKREVAGTTIATLAKIILKKHKKAVIKCLATIEGVSAKKYTEKLTLAKLPMDFMSFMSDPDVQALFQSQSQETDETSFGSATQNTEAETSSTTTEQD